MIDKFGVSLQKNIYASNNSSELGLLSLLILLSNLTAPSGRHVPCKVTKLPGQQYRVEYTVAQAGKCPEQSIFSKCFLII